MTPQPERERNPYRPGAAISPLYLAGRDRELRRFEATRRSAPELPPNVRLTGLRGVGKTVLLKEFEKNAKDGGWAAIRYQLEPRHNREEELTALLVQLCDGVQQEVSRTARVKEKIKGVAAKARGLVHVKYEDFEFSLGSLDHATRTMATALLDVTTVADSAGHEGLIVMLDEAQVLHDEKGRAGQHPLSLLIATINALQERQLPIGLVLCGLPTLRTRLLRARTYTERMFRGEEIGRLNGTEAREAFVRPLDGTGVTAADGLVDRVVHEVEGYPFFIQLWGAELWEAARSADLDVFDDALLDQVETDIYRRLDVDFYEGRVEALTPAEQDLLMSTADCPYPPLKTADIHGRAGKSESNVNVLMGRLTEQGIVFRTQKGQYEYTAPKFHDFLQRRTRLRAQRGH